MLVYSGDLYGHGALMLLVFCHFNPYLAVSSLKVKDPSHRSEVKVGTFNLFRSEAAGQRSRIGY